jgi:hypothetical protein
MFPGPLVDKFSGEIQKLGLSLRWIKRLMPILETMPVKIFISTFRFSADFDSKMVLPYWHCPWEQGIQTSDLPVVDHLYVIRLW